MGLNCHYRWETIEDQPRVVEHWTSDGEHFHYRYDFNHRTSWATDALDGSAESFTYNALGQVLTHTDGKGQTTRLLRTARGPPSSRQDAKGQRIRYEYDPAIRLTALVNENNAAYPFAYDASDRLIEEKRIDNLTRRFSYNIGGHLKRVDESATCTNSTSTASYQRYGTR